MCVVVCNRPPLAWAGMRRWESVEAGYNLPFPPPGRLSQMSQEAGLGICHLPAGSSKVQRC